MNMPESPSIEGLETKWMERWEADGVYRFDRSKPREAIYAVDTPPPTVSGTLHIGSAFSYTHTDIIVRYKRMRGMEIFYPMGWDDNGLPTERRVQNFYGVRCDPSLPYDPEFSPPPDPPKNPIPISRPNFIELCTRLTAEDEKAMEETWRMLGLSVDWTMTYATIDEGSRRISQRSFVRLLKRGLVYQAEAPTYWDIDFQTSVAQAELEDREIQGAFHRIRFHGIDGDDVFIDTTRPELIPACVALVAHPDDPRFRDRFDSYVSTPLFASKIPIRPHRLADPEKGTGIAMICTFGDVTDVQWWRELNLPVRAILRPDGTIRQIMWGEEGWESLDPDRAQRQFNELVGLPIKKARQRITEFLRDSGDLAADPVPMTHPVKFYERGDRPLEIITSRQWYIKVLDFKDDFIKRGREIKWHPEFMRARYENWVEGLNIDWNISRQRYFGIPFPIWYRIGDDGSIDYDRPIAAHESMLPVDPSTDVPPGYAEDQRGKPGGFIGDPDIMDTWATSALTPQIAGKWEDDPDLFQRVFPMDHHPQAHEIIRTWLFVTVVRSHFEHNSIPWKHAAISGFVSDPERKKMSKSKGNIVTPRDRAEEFGSDGIRYWAAGGRPGYDTVEDVGQMKIGRRLAIKILNVSRFVLSRLGPEGEVTEPLDRSMLSGLVKVIEDATRSLDDYDYTRALERIESFFWSFCDDYVELAKARAYGSSGEEGAASANRALTTALSAQLRLLAPYLPFVTEEVWSWWREGSIHRSEWPSPDELNSLTDGADGVLDIASQVLSEIRKAKTGAKKSLRTEVERLVVRGTPETLEALRLAEDDLKNAGNVSSLEFQRASDLAVEVTLATE